MSTQTSYSELLKQGLVLPEQDFQKIIDTLNMGVKDALMYLKVSDDEWPRLQISDSVTAFGYSGKDDSICLSLRHLNHIASNATPIIYKDQLICFVPDKFYIIIKYLSWLRLFGRESTIHRYQKTGNSMLKTSFPEPFPKISPKMVLLSDMEVEARTVSDNISISLGESALWERLNLYLSEFYPEYYNRTVSQLENVAVPDFPISFELESFGL